MDLKTKCDIIVKREVGRMDFDPSGEYYPSDLTLKEICKDYENWKNEPVLLNYFEPLINSKINIEHYEEMTKPLSERNWVVSYDNRGAYPKRDIIYLRGQIGADYYVYVHDEYEGTYGKQFEVAVNGKSVLYLLPTIKQFSDELEVGKCFIIHYEKEITFGGNRKKYCYKITEISEQEYLNGVIDADLKTFGY